jgi:hypothetical protein
MEADHWADEARRLVAVGPTPKRQKVSEKGHWIGTPTRARLCKPGCSTSDHLPPKWQNPESHPGFARWPKLTCHLMSHQSVKAAESLTCPLCTFARRAPEWAKVASIDPALPDKTWLVAKPPAASPWGWGCLVCRSASADADIGSAWAKLEVGGNSLCKTNLLRHAHSRAHEKATHRFLQRLGLAHGDHLDAPPVNDFHVVLRASRRGGANVDDVGNHDSRKLATISWCLFEALRDQDREFMQKVRAMSVCQDGRQAVLQVRFVACDASMSTRSGLLAMTVGHPTSAWLGNRSSGLHRNPGNSATPAQTHQRVPCAK